MKRFDVWLANLDPRNSSEIRETRPAVILSPDELNVHLATVIVVPLTIGHFHTFSTDTRVAGKNGVAAIDQIRTSTEHDW